MAKLPANLTRQYLDQYNISGHLNAFDQNVDQELIDVTCFSDAGPRRLVGNYDEQDSYLGFVDVATGSIDDIIAALLGSASDHYYAKVLPASLSSGLPVENSVAYETILHLTKSPRSAKLGGAILLNFDGAGAGGSCRATVLRSAALSASGAGTGRNLGVTTSGQVLQMVFRLLATSGGAGSLAMRVQESSDDAAGDPYGNISGLAATISNDVGVARASVTIATEAWKRVDYTLTTWTSATVLVTVGVVKGT